ncbi:threonine efflux protein [Sulfurospirillum diekertiae]|uniref:Threonine efflux protein n=1 Tax=Sulfurospirillum diekertiae TaxID=1854492 RepID=A0A290HRG0_9BACT|nr:LysE family transporter [Sulfurospirillum diekertiae]ATB70288.1 threonine efflux protein [Sulfurospirillum diekertiae]
MFGVEFITLTSIYFLALLSPGQDFFLIIKHALTHGYKKAWWSCLGIASGNALYIALAYMGHTYLSQYPMIVSFIEIGGALFLLYLGCLLLFAPKPNLENALHVKSKMVFKLFVQGLLSALFNPKNILFYFSLLFTIVKPETVLHVKIVYAVWMVTMLLVWDMFVAFLFGNQSALRLLPYLNFVQKIVGIGLIGFSLKLAFTFYKQCEL